MDEEIKAKMKGNGFSKSESQVHRCAWVNLSNPVYVKYHDEEWSRPVHDDAKLYEFLVLETFLAGLSWECILNKREGFRKAFDGFRPERVAAYGEADLQRLLTDSRIIRNRLKVKATIVNSRVFLDIQRTYGSFDAYIWEFTQGKVLHEPYPLRTTSGLSDRISTDLKKRGMKFVGSTTIYAYLQTIGVLQAHGAECDWYKRKGGEDDTEG